MKLTKENLKSLPKSSGVYKFYDKNKKILYVGKAKNLFNRISSYTIKNSLSAKTARMVSLIDNLEYIQTSSEVEALLLEHNLIKELMPRYNVLLRDDKTFPEILISNHKFPQITKYRNHKNNSKSKKGFLYGPFASGFDVNKTIEAMRKIFLLRNCSDSEFKSRKKPCLEYQIKKCSGPCVGLISQEEYNIGIENAKDFLKGKSQEIQKRLEEKMYFYSQKEDFEKAAEIRDQIKSLNAIQIKQDINIKDLQNCDVVTIVNINDQICIYVSFYRIGRNLGAKPYFFKNQNDNLLEDFLGQFYLSHRQPDSIIINKKINEKKLIEGFLEKISDKKVKVTRPQKGKKFELITNQEKIALQTLERKITQNLTNKELLLEVKKLFGLKKMPQKIEVYDNSHTGTKNAVGCMIMAGIDGFIKSGYRKFNIKNLESKLDDTAMLKEVLTRRFSKLNKNEYPDLIIIDGGKGQLNAANEVFKKLKIDIAFICISKGINRNAGEEYFHQVNKESFTLEKNNPVMYYLQRLRDEAHRFAIMTHRKKRDKDMLL